MVRDNRTMLKPFLTARWQYLAMLNFRVDPAILAPHVPVGTEIDFHHGETYVSVIGFQFHHTVVMGLPIPGHQNFEEVNLRFYVRKQCGDTWRRGVVFIRELVPKIAIAMTARVFYGEPYQALPMRHVVTDCDGELNVRYEWRRGREWESLAMSARGAAKEIPAGSHEEFITEHYWGYTRRGQRTSEYQVEHPRWNLWTANQHEFKADVATLYGEKFLETLGQAPVSAFIADGSSVAVYQRRAGADLR